MDLNFLNEFNKTFKMLFISLILRILKFNQNTHFKYCQMYFLCSHSSNESTSIDYHEKFEHRHQQY